MTVGGWHYLGVFVATSLLTLLLTPIALRIAMRRGIFDLPSDIKAQSSPVPYLGGLAITLAFTAVVLVAAFVRRPTSGLSELTAILLVAALLGVLGLIDDLRGLGPYLRLVMEVAAGVAVWLFAEPVALAGIDAVDAVLTVLWVTAVTNAVNMLDNMDGLSAGTSAIAAFWIFVMAVDNGQFLVAVLAVALCGCAAGFLRSNFHPARIYMGDAGSLFIGFLLAVLALKLRFNAPSAVTFSVPVLVLGVPLFDMALVTVNRLLHGRSPLRGGRDHTSHRMVFVGIPVPYVVALIYAGGVSVGWLATVMSDLERGTAFLLMSWIAGVALFLGVLLSTVPVYETSRRRHLMIQEVRGREEPRDVQGSSEEDETRTAEA